MKDTKTIHDNLLQVNVLLVVLQVQIEVVFFLVQDELPVKGEISERNKVKVQTKYLLLNMKFLLTSENHVVPSRYNRFVVGNGGR